MFINKFRFCIFIEGTSFWLGHFIGRLHADQVCEPLIKRHIHSYTNDKILYQLKEECRKKIIINLCLNLVEPPRLGKEC